MPIAVGVFGSLNHDVTVTLPRFPRPDETLACHGIADYCGGKGFNQAVAAAELGARCTMIGAVGHDPAGDLLLSRLRVHGVDGQYVARSDAHTGTAIPLVTDEGEVSILIVPGANGSVSATDAERARPLLEQIDVLLLQGEVDHAASARAAAIVRTAGGLVVFSPAPVHDDARLVLPHASFVVANRNEAEQLGLQPSESVVVTRGADGALVEDTLVPAIPTDVIDPTGAGDAFTAAFAVAVAEGQSPVEAVRFAVAAGSWAVRIAGAEPSMPTRDQVLQVLGQAS
jgi:ribokinase